MTMGWTQLIPAGVVEVGMANREQRGGLSAIAISRSQSAVRTDRQQERREAGDQRFARIASISLPSASAS